MGAVWLGRDEVLGRDVAIKRIGHAPGADAPDLVRAEREARLAASLNHQNVVAVFDLVDEGDERWLVMEYVEGRTLSALVKESGPLSPDDAAPLVRQAAEALAVAHEAGIVHRDVKPSNMLVTDAGQLKILDFGIARATADATLTQTGLVTGSPAYLAPEVATGSSATAKSDVWSLGATLHHLLTGRPPFDASDLMGTLYKIVHEDPPRTPHAGWLAPLVTATMTREPEDRWTMRGVADFLAGRGTPEEATQQLPTAVGAVAPLPVDSEPQTPPPDPRSSSHRRRSSSPVVAVLGLAVVALLGVLAWQLLSGGNDDSSDPVADPPSSRSEPPSESTTPSESESSSPSEEPNPAEQRKAMEAFVEDYVADVTSDPASTFSRLTPEFQEKSRGFDGYTRWWSSIAEASITKIKADPKAGTVTYTATYVKTDGSRVTDDVRLHLVEKDGGWLIADEG